MKWFLAACGVVVLAAAGVFAAIVLRSHSIPRHTTTRPTITIPPPKPPKKNTSLPWPTYGADNARTRAVTVPGLRPPYRKLWTFYSHKLLEFPPVAGYGLLYEESFDGLIRALDPVSGKVKWTHDLHRCGWSSPALGEGLLFATSIGDVKGRCARLPNGGLVALNARTGTVRWSQNIGQSESSPLYSHGTVYVGSTDGNVYAFNAKTGRQRWSFAAGGAVKGSPALVHGRIFIGTYGGTFYALNARTGAPIWHNGGHGNFYGGASVADGRVYVGNVDGHVYAFSARTGAQIWNFGTGYYVYASTAVWRGIVLVGSYDNYFYAINGATGSERWHFHTNGPISGAASVIDGIVYFSTLRQKTYALNAATGHLIEEWNDGDYNAAVAAYGRLFLIGEGRIYALEPRRSVKRSRR